VGRVSHFFRLDLPFEQERMERVAQDKRGVSLLAVCGGVDITLERVSVLHAVEPPRPEQLASQEGQDNWKILYDQEEERLAPCVEELIGRLHLPGEVPDHVVFLLQPTITFPSTSMIENRLQSRLGANARVVSLAGSAQSRSVGEGITYLNGEILTNVMAVLCLSGFLPLQQDIHRLMALHLARFTNSPTFDLERLRALESSPVRRLINGEVIRPVRDLAYAFGPHPLETLVEFFGLDQIKMLQQADKLEVFEINPKPVASSPPAGGANNEGYEIVPLGKTLGPESARELAAALLTEETGPNGLSSCEWRPGIVFRFWRGKESATLVVCFECYQSTFQFYDANGTLVRGTFPFWFSGRQVLLRLAREALPDSAVLTGIK